MRASLHVSNFLPHPDRLLVFDILPNPARLSILVDLPPYMLNFPTFTFHFASLVCFISVDAIMYLGPT